MTTPANSRAAPQASASGGKACGPRPGRQQGRDEGQEGRPRCPREQPTPEPEARPDAQTDGRADEPQHPADQADLVQQPGGHGDAQEGQQQQPGRAQPVEVEGIARAFGAHFLGRPPGRPGVGVLAPAERALRREPLRGPGRFRQTLRRSLSRDFFGGQRHVPGEADQGERADDVVAHVDLPPAQAVPGRGREGVVGVVPALAQRQDAEHDVVAALVVAPVGPQAPQVADRVDAPGDVVDQEDAHQPAPDQPRPDAHPASA